MRNLYELCECSIDVGGQMNGLNEAWPFSDKMNISSKYKKKICREIKQFFISPLHCIFLQYNMPLIEFRRATTYIVVRDRSVKKMKSVDFTCAIEHSCPERTQKGEVYLSVFQIIFVCPFNYPCLCQDRLYPATERNCNFQYCYHHHNQQHYHHHHQHF